MFNLLSSLSFALMLILRTLSKHSSISELIIPNKKGSNVKQHSNSKQMNKDDRNYFTRGTIRYAKRSVIIISHALARQDIKWLF